jgi:sugar O-acyltransferase (sialic acid O-acetyltransferase NeuD family)
MADLKIAIFGTAGFAREVHQLVMDIRDDGGRLRCEGFLVDREYQDRDEVHGYPVLGDAGWLIGRPEVHTVIAIGATGPRQRIAGQISSKAGSPFATLVHPRASVGNSVSIDVGSIVCAGAVATVDIALGRHVQLHANCTVGHDVTLGDFVTVAPGAVISGRVRVGEGTFLGAGAVVLPDVQVGNWVMVGAGAVVTKDVPDNVVVTGVPAKLLEAKGSLR